MDPMQIFALGWFFGIGVGLVVGGLIFMSR